MMLVLALVLAALCGSANAQFGGWRDGRATFYGTDAWQIDKGSCGFGWLDRNVATGWDIVAISDVAPDYQGSCGKCKEVKCRNSGFNDGYGQWLDRTNICFNTYASVVVMVTDTCPCQYPGNYYSNKRWCCGDIYHLDLSVWAYEKLAEKKWGVIAVSWRDVPCWYRPKSPARTPGWAGGPSPQPWWMRRPDNWNRNMDKRLTLSTVRG